ncbi:hypothetical protein ACWCQM_11765 [Streptomyces sp. NPDC002125]
MPEQPGTSITTVVYRPGDSTPDIEATQIIAVRAWLLANDIDPRNVPTSTDLTVVTEPDGQRTIHYHRFVLTPEGRRQIDPDRPNEVWTEKVTAPCVIVRLFGKLYRWEPGDGESLVLHPVTEDA